MHIAVHEKGPSRVAELRGEGVLLGSAQDALDLLGDVRHRHETGKLVFHAENVADDFFVLRTGIAGEILQKFTNYGAAVAFVGDISRFTRESESLRDFVRESNRVGRVRFALTLDEAVRELHRL